MILVTSAFPLIPDSVCWIEHVHTVITPGRVSQAQQFAWTIFNTANLRDLIAATGLVISTWIQIVDFSSRVTVKFDGWPRKTIGHFFYNMSSFVQHFKSIGEVKLELQSGNTQFGSKLVIFCPVWPWSLTDDLHKLGHLSYAAPGSMPDYMAIGKFKLELQSGNAWFWVNIEKKFSRVTMKFDGWPWKIIGHLFLATWNSVHHFTATCQFKLEYGPEAHAS